MVVPVLMTSCQVSEKWNNGPVTAHATMIKVAATNANGDPVACATPCANWRKRSSSEKVFFGGSAKEIGASNGRGALEGIGRRCSWNEASPGAPTGRGGGHSPPRCAGEHPAASPMYTSSGRRSEARGAHQCRASGVEMSPCLQAKPSIHSVAIRDRANLVQ